MPLMGLDGPGQIGTDLQRSLHHNDSHLADSGIFDSIQPFSPKSWQWKLKRALKVIYNRVIALWKDAITFAYQLSIINLSMSLFWVMISVCPLELAQLPFGIPDISQSNVFYFLHAVQSTFSLICFKSAPSLCFASCQFNLTQQDGFWMDIWIALMC